MGVFPHTHTLLYIGFPTFLEECFFLLQWQPILDQQGDYRIMLQNLLLSLESLLHCAPSLY
jgi:hypothetical protein